VASFTLKFGWKKTDMVDMPSPSVDGFNIGREKVWNAKAGRSSSALYSGTIKSVKTTLDMSFPANLTNAQREKLLKYASPTPSDLKSNPSHKYCYITFTNETGDNETIQVYFGNPSFEAHVFMNGKYLSQSFSIQAVER
jgi:hypothetical protein